MNDKKLTRMERTMRKHEQRKRYFNYTGVSKYSILETPKPISSCRCCSNPRRTWKGKDRLTIQERKKETFNTHELF